MDPINTTTNPLGSAPSSAMPAVDEPVGTVGTAVPQVPVEPIAEEPIVVEPTLSDSTISEEPTARTFDNSGEPTASEPVAVEPMASVAEPTVGTEEPIAEETVEPTTEVADTTGLGGVTNPTV